MFQNYDPSNVDGDFLSKKEVTIALIYVRTLEISKEDPRTEETLKIIEFFESERRECCLNNKSLNDLYSQLDKLNLKFRAQFDDWFHHDNPVYDSFYLKIDELRKEE
jgi:hypothetical protein